ALEHEVEVLDRALLHLLEQGLERDARRARRELLASQPLTAHLGEMARLALVLDHSGMLARRGWLVEADDLDRLAGLRLLDLLAPEVEQPAHAPVPVAGDDRVADPERAAMDEH